MHRLIFYILFLMSFCVYSQIDRSRIPKGDVASEIKIGKIHKIELENGLKVFVIENHKIPVVSYSLQFDINPSPEGKYAGLSSVTFELLGTATEKRTKNQLDNEIDFMGATLRFSENSVYASVMKKYNDQLLEIISDALIHPNFLQEELDKIINQNLTVIKANENDPDFISQRVSNVLMFGKKNPYGEIYTEKTLHNINLDLCKNYYKKTFIPNTAYLAIIGDITLVEAEQMVRKYFGKWEKGIVRSTHFAKIKPPSNRKIIVVDRPNSVQSVIKICYPLDFKIGGDDYIKTILTNIILGEKGGTYRLFMNLREKNGYTYGAYSSFTPDKFKGVFKIETSVRTSVTDSAIDQILYEMNRLRNEKILENEFLMIKNYLIGDFALSLEMPETVADFAFQIESYKLNSNFYIDYLKNIQKVSINDIQQMAQKYILPDNCYILVVGKATDIINKLKRFSPNAKVLIYNSEAKLIKIEK